MHYNAGSTRSARSLCGVVFDNRHWQDRARHTIFESEVTCKICLKIMAKRGLFDSAREAGR